MLHYYYNPPKGINNYMHSLYNNCFLFFYGFIVSITYFIMSKLGGQDSLLYFFYSTLILGLIFGFKSKLKDVFNPLSNLRGFLFALTQYLLISSQINGSVSSSFIAALAGTVTAALLANIFLKESVKQNILPLLLALSGCFVISNNNHLDLNSFFAGILQGTSATLTRGISKSRESFFTSIFQGFFWSAAISPLFKVPFDASIVPSTIFLYVLSLGMCQLAYFKLYSENQTLKASIVGLGRIPWAIAIESTLLGTAITAQALFGSILIFLGALFNLLGKKFSNKV